MNLSEWTRSDGARREHAAVIMLCIMGMSIASLKVSGGASSLNSPSSFFSRCVSGYMQYLFQEDCILQILIL